jgi:hypothetical protein
MPYTNIVFVKFKLELLKDYRFTDKLNDSQKLVFLSLLLLAGMTDNKIPHDTSYIKRILNLDMSPDTIEEAIKQIMTHFPKLLSDKGVISFTKFEEIHNYKIGKPEIEKGVEQNKKKNKEEEKEEDKKHKHLDFVFLTKSEYALLEERFKSNLPAKIESLNNYIGSKGKKYKSHYHTLLNWARMEEKPQPKQRCDF